MGFIIHGIGSDVHGGGCSSPLILAIITSEYCSHNLGAILADNTRLD
jgi:hypothetical protein